MSELNCGQGANKRMTESDVMMVALQRDLSLSRCACEDDDKVGSELAQDRHRTGLISSAVRLRDQVRPLIHTHIENHASSDAEALKNVATNEVGKWEVACYTIRPPYTDFPHPVGLNAVRPIQGERAGKGKRSVR